MNLTDALLRLIADQSLKQLKDLLHTDGDRFGRLLRDDYQSLQEPHYELDSVEVAEAVDVEDALWRRAAHYWMNLTPVERTLLVEHVRSLNEDPDDFIETVRTYVPFDWIEPELAEKETVPMDELSEELEEAEEAERVDYFTLAKEYAGNWQEPLMRMHAAMSYIRSELPEINAEPEDRLKVRLALDILESDLVEFRRIEGVLFETAAQAGRVNSDAEIIESLRRLKAKFRIGLVKFNEAVEAAKEEDEPSLLPLLVLGLGADILNGWRGVHEGLEGFLQDLA